MKDLAAILESLRMTPSILNAFVSGVPADALNQRRGDGFWTIAEHTAHLAEVQPMLLERLERILDEDDPEFVPYIPCAEAEPAPAMDVQEALEAFAKGRARQMQAFNSMAPEAWRRLARHHEYEQYGLYILARHMLMHDYWHMYRMEELWLARDAYLTTLEG